MRSLVPKHPIHRSQPWTLLVLWLDCESSQLQAKRTTSHRGMSSAHAIDVSVQREEARERPTTTCSGMKSGKCIRALKQVFHCSGCLSQSMIIATGQRRLTIHRAIVRYPPTCWQAIQMSLNLSISVCISRVKSDARDRKSGQLSCFLHVLAVVSMQSE